MKEEGKGSKAPLTEAFGALGATCRMVLIALFGAVAGQAVVWYTGQFYALFFLEKMLKVDGATANILIAIALALGTPFFILFGWLSDKIGRKPIILAGCALAALTYFPLFEALTEAANPALARAQARAPVRSIADPADCSVQFDPIGRNKFDRAVCDIAKSSLATPGVPYANVAAPAGTSPARLGDRRSPSSTALREAERAPAIAAFQAEARAALTAAGYPGKADPGGDQQAAGRRDPVHPRPLRDDGLRADRGAAGRAVPDPHPLHLDVAALSYRQRLVRRLPADHRLRDGRGDRRYLLRALVPDRRSRC